MHYGNRAERPENTEVHTLEHFLFHFQKGHYLLEVTKLLVYFKKDNIFQR